MSEKYPALETIDHDIPDAEAGDGDFLSREKELLGDEFQTENDKDVLATSDDEINDFKEQFPEVDDKQAAATVEDDDDEFEGFGLAPSAPVLGDSEHLKQWKERRDLEIEQREKVASTKKEEIVSKARQTIDDFYENYNNKKEQHAKEALKEQDDFLTKRDGFLTRGTLWDRVNELVSEIGELPDDGARDKTRFKGLLTKLKGKEDAPGAGGY